MDAAYIIGLLGKAGSEAAALDIQNLKPDMFPAVVFRAVFLVDEQAKLAEQQARLKELEQKKLEAENTEIVDIVRGLSISLDELPVLLQAIRSGAPMG